MSTRQLCVHSCAQGTAAAVLQKLQSEQVSRLLAFLTWLGFSPPAVLANLESLNGSLPSGSPPVTDLFQLMDV